MLGEVEQTDAERLELLDRIAKRVPELDLAQHELRWDELPDGGQALFVGGEAEYFANCGEDLHAYGSLDPVVPGVHRLHRDQAGRQPLPRSGGA
jgi:hypothetical protein